MTAFDTPTFISTNGIRMAVYEQGAGKSAGAVSRISGTRIFVAPSDAAARRRRLSRARARPTRLRTHRQTGRGRGVRHRPADRRPGGPVRSLRLRGRDLRRPRLGRPRRMGHGAAASEARRGRHQPERAVSRSRHDRVGRVLGKDARRRFLHRPLQPQTRRCRRRVRAQSEEPAAQPLPDRPVELAATRHCVPAWR